MCIESNTFLVRDQWTGRYFQSNVDEIERAMNEINALMNSEGDIDLNTVYDRLGLEPVEAGNEIGWSGETIQLVYGNATAGPGAPLGTPRGLPIMTIGFRKNPTVAYDSRI